MAPKNEDEGQEEVTEVQAPKPKSKKRATSLAQEDEGEEGKSVQKKPRAKKKESKEAGPSVDELGWNIIPPSLLWKDYGTTPSAKIAAFDLDGTLVNTKSGSTFAKNAEDWKFFNKKVPEVLKQAQADGYKIVIFSNQGGVKSALTGKQAANVKGKVDQAIEKAGVSALVLLATLEDENRKPSTGMWDYMCAELNGGVTPDKSKSYFVGDAAGRPTDFLDAKTNKPVATDRDFAANIGIQFKVPEDVFGAMEGKKVQATGGPIDFETNVNGELLSMLKEMSDFYFASTADSSGSAAGCN